MQVYVFGCGVIWMSLIESENLFHHFALSNGNFFHEIKIILNFYGKKEEKLFIVYKAEGKILQTIPQVGVIMNF